VCGEAQVWGDLIVPTCCAHLPGAAQLELDGVFYSPLGAGVLPGAPATVPDSGGQSAARAAWYGCEGVLPLWLASALGGGAEVGAVAETSVGVMGGREPSCVLTLAAAAEQDVLKVGAAVVAYQP
jgi:hypothetical protein